MRAPPFLRLTIRVACGFLLAAVGWAAERPYADLQAAVRAGDFGAVQSLIAEAGGATAWAIGVFSTSVPVPNAGRSDFPILVQWPGILVPAEGGAGGLREAQRVEGEDGVAMTWHVTALDDAVNPSAGLPPG